MQSEAPTKMTFNTKQNIKVVKTGKTKFFYILKKPK